ncbi:hypothetical protein V1477_004073 [Vespula maculifrons]|uniref:Uncharacterized protein n=1 Tax=Vespula maculifrons TaxID=7453 RepID=A0ABD2CQK0_VESMC
MQGGHDRSCLEMSEADGVDGGAICKRGFTHLQFAEKSEAPEAERHLGSVESPLARGSPMQQPPRGVTWVGSTWYISKSYKVQVFPSEWLHISKSFPYNSKLKVEVRTFYILSYIFRIFGNNYTINYYSSSRVGPMSWAHGRGLLCGSLLSVSQNRALFSYSGFSRLLLYCISIFSFQFHGFHTSDVSSVHTLSLNADTGRIGRTLTPVSAGTDVVFSGASKSPPLAGPQMQQPPSGGTWVGSTCDIWKSLCKLYHNSITRLYVLSKIYIEIVIRWCGGDALPLGRDIRRPSLTVGPVMSRISTIRISIFAVRMLRNQREGVIIKWSSGDTLPPAAAVDSWSSHATNFHHSHLKTRSTHVPQVKEKGIRWCGGDTLPPVNWSSHATNFHHSHLKTRSTHAPQVKEKGQCITEEDLDQRRCRPTSFSTNYKSSTLNFDLNRGPVFWSRRRTSKVVRHEAKKRLYAEEAPTYCGSRGQLLGYKVRSSRDQSSRDRSSRDRSSLGDRGTNHRGIFTRKHDRSCLEMSEADGVDGGAICKRGFTHLQFAEKSEAPEAERHLGSVESPLARGSPMQQPPRGVTWVGSTWYISKSYKVQVFPSEWLHISKSFPKSFPYNSKLKVDVRTFCILSYIFRIFGNNYTINYCSSSRVGPMSWAHGRGLLCGSLLSVSQNRALFSYSERRLFDHAGHANFRVESPLARGSPDAATSKRWDLGR